LLLAEITTVNVADKRIKFSLTLIDIGQVSANKMMLLKSL